MMEKTFSEMCSGGYMEVLLGRDGFFFNSNALKHELKPSWISLHQNGLLWTSLNNL